MPCSINELLKESKAGYSLDIFGNTAVAAIEARLTEKSGKPYVKCLVRGKDVQAKPEEIVRQLWIHRLVNHYGYPITRITVEYPITFGRDTSKRADIVVFDADRPNVPYQMVEIKETKAKDGKDQLKSYTHATGAPLAVWSNGIQTVVWHRKNPNYFVEIPELPTATQSIEDIASQPWTIDTLIEKEKKREEEGASTRSLAERCRILAVVSLHPNTFKPHTGTRTSVLFVQKWNDDPHAGPLCQRLEDYNVFFAIQQLESKDTSGHKLVATKEGKPLRDSHGHWIVKHDLFNHDGLTEDGIAEGFAEFVQTENLSFSTLKKKTKQNSLSACPPKDSRHSNPPVTFVRRFSEIRAANRMDAEFFNPIAFAMLRLLQQKGSLPLRKVADVTTGYPWKSEYFIDSNEGPGEPFVRIRDCKPTALQIEDLDKLDSAYAASQGQAKAQPGDLAVGMDGLKWFYASLLIDPCYVNQRVAHLKTKSDASVSPEFLLATLNSHVGQRQLLRAMTIAHTVGHITLDDIRDLLIPRVSDKVHDQITATVARAQAAQREARLLMDKAKQALEIAIEQDEAAASRFLDQKES